MNAQITGSIKHDGLSSPFIRVARGTFALNGATKPPSTASNAPPLEPVIEDLEAQYDIISSFGMFWRRDAIEWRPSPHLFGMQSLGAAPVDFNQQLGIYLLYDAREVIYVGRSTERPLGRRLYEHTLDRLSTRWDRFSWFGLLPVAEDGSIGPMPGSFESTKLISALEAVMIEALEPRQNRKRGDDLATVEYLQKVDPEVEKRRTRATLEVALSKL